MAQANYALVEPASGPGLYAAELTGKNGRRLRRAAPIADKAGIPKDGTHCGEALALLPEETAAGHASRLNTAGFLTVSRYR